ncbi:MAG: hypothetical protein C0P77_013230 [Thermoanaerobacterales bacterium]
MNHDETIFMAEQRRGELLASARAVRRRRPGRGRRFLLFRRRSG